MKNIDKTKNELLKELQELRQENNSLKASNADIPKYKKSEEDLLASEIRYRRLFESAKDGILILDAETGKIVDVNPFLIDLLGFTYEEFTEKTIWEIGSFKDIISNYEKFLELQKNEYVRYHDLPIVTNHGRKIHVEFVSNVYSANNKDVIQCNIRDISQRIKIETDLIEAKEKAEESDRLKTAFLTNMSHEIRTPMNGILGFTELLKEPNLKSDDIQDYIQIIHISGIRMLNTINNIVDVSKIESGLIQINISETNINEKMEFTYKFFKPEVEFKGLQFSLKNGLTTKESIIKTDNEKVYGILTNLVRNAIKFTYEGSIIFGYDKKGEFLEFFVKDTGAGIPENQKKLIFERFRQGSESHNRGYEGSGLGLSIAKSYVEMLGGKIWVESEEGRGSTFYFTIPYNAVSEEKTEITDVVSSDLKEIQLHNLKILIVEDDEISYSLLKKMLQKISKEVLHAMTGIEAIEACRNNPDLDLVLMDIRMPVMDGNEAISMIRHFNKDVIIIAQTAYAFSGDKEMAIEAGSNDYISKPINSTSLFELIRKHIK
jgi:PAS domain S-box-containing protein